MKKSAEQLVFSLIYALIWPPLFFFAAGCWCWKTGWIFNAWLVGTIMLIVIYLFVKNPALLNERFRKQGSGGQKGWDRLVMFLLFLLFLTWIIGMPLDAKRYGWTPFFSMPVRILGAVFLLLATFMLFRSFRDNTYLSPLVRFQHEREQKVVSTGVYGFVRHPMYLGAALMYLGGPLFINSYVGLAAGGLTVLLLVLRIMGEEKMLLKELPDYAAYRQKVRYHLLPYIW